MCDQQSLRSAYAYAQSDQYSMNFKLLAEHCLEFLSLKAAAEARLSLHMSKCHIVGNHMLRLIICIIFVFGFGLLQKFKLVSKSYKRLTTTENTDEMSLVSSPLTHLCQMDFPISINRMSSFPILGLLGGSFHFCSNLKRTFCEQTVQNLIRRPMWRLIWVCTVCPCHTKRMQGLNGLTAKLLA